jgi:hypothetical protein
MPYQSPNFTDGMDLILRSERSIGHRVRGLTCRVRVAADVLGVNIGAHGEVRGNARRTLLLVQSARASDQPSPIPPASLVCRQRPVPPPVRRLERL